MTLALIKLLLTIVLLAHIAASTLLYKESFSTVTGEEMFKSLFCYGCEKKPEVCSKNIDYIAQQKESNYFNLTESPIANNSLNIKGIQCFILESNISVQFPTVSYPNVSVLSAVFIPKNTEIKGIVAYMHPTTFGPLNGPSSFKPEYKAIASLYASKGYIVFMLDYFGFAGGNVTQQAYIFYPEQMIRILVNGLNFLIVDPIFLAKVPFFEHLDLYINGYSEGGSYCIWASKCIQNPKLCPNYTGNGASFLTLDKGYVFKKAIGLDGAYDVSGIVNDFLLSNVSLENNTFQIEYQFQTNMAKGSLISLAMQSFRTFSLTNVKLFEVLSYEFFMMECLIQSLCNVAGTQRVNITGALMSHYSSLQISEAISFSAHRKFTRDYQVRYAGRDLKELTYSTANSIRSLVESDWIRSPELIDAMNGSTIVQFGATSKRDIFVFSLLRDSVVSVLNTRKFLENAGGNPKVTSFFFPNKQHLVCSALVPNGAPVDHISGEALANIFALAAIP